MSQLLGPLCHPCDLDLLLFFHRHPRVLVTSERLAAFVGYDVKRVGRSLDTLIKAGALQRSPHPGHEARLYVLSGESAGGWLAAILTAASSDEGRTALARALRTRAGDPKIEAVRAVPPSVSDVFRDPEEERHA
jgi:hypothetical protein